MSKLLPAPGATPHAIAPTTTRKIAQRMLSASQEAARAMPRGFYMPTALDILLTLYVAEDDARYLSPADLSMPASTSKNAMQRWVIALVAEGLVEQKRDLLALSHNGYELVTTLIEAIYAAQRSLD